MDGILNINKSPGMTSFDVVSIIKRLTREKRVGHAGTAHRTVEGRARMRSSQASRLV